MHVKTGNIYNLIPDDLSDEVFEILVQNTSVTIERIISRGHSSPETGWYDQDSAEWVIVLTGEARIAFENDAVVELKQGDYINIPANKRHRVVSTSSDPETIWLAVHY
jgi:cupin 2 domain-containing protein